jgi:hypothetical protein
MLENFVSYAGFEHSLGSSQLPTVSKKESAHVVLSFTLDLAAKSHLENATSQGTGKQPGSNPEQSLHPKSGNKSVGTVSSPAQWEAPGLPTLSSSACKGPNKIVKCPCLYSHHPWYNPYPYLYMCFPALNNSVHWGSQKVNEWAAPLPLLQNVQGSLPQEAWLTKAQGIRWETFLSGSSRKGL